MKFEKRFARAGAWRFFAMAAHWCKKCTASSLRLVSEFLESKTANSSFRKDVLLCRCWTMSTWLKNMSELRTEKVGSSSIRARTTSFKYCNRQVCRIFFLISGSLIGTTSLYLELSDRYWRRFALWVGQ